MTPEQSRENRRQAYANAKALLKQDSVTINELQKCLLTLPESGHKALALRVRIQRKIEGLPHDWETD